LQRRGALWTLETPLSTRVRIVLFQIRIHHELEDLLERRIRRESMPRHGFDFL